MPAKHEVLVDISADMQERMERTAATHGMTANEFADLAFRFLKLGIDRARSARDQPQEDGNVVYMQLRRS